MSIKKKKYTHQRFPPQLEHSWPLPHRHGVPFLMASELQVRVNLEQRREIAGWRANIFKISGVECGRRKLQRDIFQGGIRKTVREVLNCLINRTVYASGAAQQAGRVFFIRSRAGNIFHRDLLRRQCLRYIYPR